jgi:formylglycine-generating enzyme required for sulfatase activity/predicted MPP superfamily phosphohydrolase/energy-coupling factor transporter ATP-binding protein EcfA2
MSIFQILHISDLHIKPKENFDRSVVLDPLIKRVVEDLKPGFKPEIVIVTGDVAYSGKKSEYKLAKALFDDLLKKLEISNDRLFIIPGNHDVDFDEYRPNDAPSYDNMAKLNTELEHKKYRKDLLKGMKNYYTFIKKSYPHLRNKHEGLVPFVHLYEAECGEKVGLIGLNSAWMCRRYYYNNKISDKGKIAVGEYQIKKAIEELKECGEFELVINIFHHPLEWLWPVDMKICKRYFNNSVLLSGHLHDSEAEDTYDSENRLLRIQAGAAYEGSEYPNRFQYITFDWDKNEIRIDYRKFDKVERKWCVEGEKGRDGIKTFEMFTKEKRKILPSESLPEIPEDYKKWIIEHCSSMEIDKLRERGEVIQVSLPEIFIPLYAYPPGKEIEGKSLSDFRKRLRDSRPGDFIRDLIKKGIFPPDFPEDIEKLAGKNEYLLIEGHPGSGKTTLLKHISYAITQKNDPKGMEDFLPVLIFLKDLKGFFDDTKEIKPSLSTAEALLSYYFRTAENGLDLETVKRFCKVKKAIFLFDGLDEIELPYRNIVVNSFADYRLKNEGNKVVFSGRPHGLEGVAIDRFSKKHIKILPLNMTQIEKFIENWFHYVYSEGSRLGEKSAQGIISEIKAHPDINKLTDNPLMLTAICILYHDGKELPGQRAELYKKSVNSLLYKRFIDYEKIHDFLKALAFHMHSKNIRGADRVFATGILKQVYKIQDSERDEEYRKRIEKLFDDIESNCGLLKYENGEYLFWHLTFQEFLAAVYIVDNSTDYIEAIKDYWDNDNYKEVIELYIGYLSIENKRWANDIVKNVIESDDKLPFKRWLLASKSMLDIHKDRRDDALLKKVRELLLSIIDGRPEPKILVESGETLGWLGDSRDLKKFVPVEGGEYELSLGKAIVKPFELGKFPVTNKWFEEFIKKADGYRNMDYWSDEGKKWLEYTETEYPLFWNVREWRCPNSPVVGVCWYEAQAFTNWLTAIDKDNYKYRLPDENEWEAAAAGFEKRTYPWGNEWGKDKCNTYELGIVKISPVGIFKNGDTPDTQISDLSGNVREWTVSDYHSGKELNDFKFEIEPLVLFGESSIERHLSKMEEKTRQLPVLRGGSWRGLQDSALCAFRSRDYPTNRFGTIGFRCARTPVK